jgi:hypothetical protein
MKKTSISLSLLILSTGLFAQFDFIKLVGDKPFKTRIKRVTDSIIIYQEGTGPEFTANLKALDFIEIGGQKVVYYNYKPADHDIYTPELKRISDEKPLDLMKKDGKVFIPITTTDKRNAVGNAVIREILPSYNLWEVVNTEPEAEFILTFIYDDSGKDKVYFILKTRDNQIFYKSRVIHAKVNFFSRNKEANDSVIALLEREMTRIKKTLKIQ